MNARQHKMKVMAGVVVSSSEKASSSVVATDKDKHGHKRKHDEKVGVIRFIEEYCFWLSYN